MGFVCEHILILILHWIYWHKSLTLYHRGNVTSFTYILTCSSASNTVLCVCESVCERERESVCVCVCVWEREREEEERAVDRIFLSVFNEKLEDVPGWEQRYGTPACQDSNVNVPLPGTWRWTGFTCRC